MGSHTDIVELAGKVTVVGIILLFFVVIFFCCLHLYFKWFYHHRHQTTTTITQRRRRRRRPLNFAAAHQEIVVMPTSRIGLEASVLKSIPVIAFDPNEFRDGLECAVCLCEVCEGEKARILPKCSHGFHVECIDMWFQSHATCPLCRNPIPNSDSESTVDDQDRSSSEDPNLPANVLFWGDETQVNALGPCVEDTPTAQPSTSAASSTTSTTSSSHDGVVVIDINPVHSRN